ncbi:hypothetical protein E2P81_ATG01132 [Venturia nashicola]|uniref:Uncharacterized protein n=1 Tax=Venturia nashicola TaxID=86259 RepID=A0A4Z1PTR1_9PEZI|nr:hypothetical protein E6O75_ATG01160 [Venturia nashicola]TLD38589.1 hypothetical protein E2P81_ATG01132 [Venturia nashicola]
MPLTTLISKTRTMYAVITTLPKASQANPVHKRAVSALALWICFFIWLFVMRYLQPREIRGPSEEAKTSLEEVPQQDGD